MNFSFSLTVFAFVNLYDVAVARHQEMKLPMTRRLLCKCRKCFSLRLNWFLRGLQWFFYYKLNVMERHCFNFCRFFRRFIFFQAFAGTTRQKLRPNLQIGRSIAVDLKVCICSALICALTASIHAKASPATGRSSNLLCTDCFVLYVHGTAKVLFSVSVRRRAVFPSQFQFSKYFFGLLINVLIIICGNVTGWEGLIFRAILFLEKNLFLIQCVHWMKLINAWGYFWTPIKKIFRYVNMEFWLPSFVRLDFISVLDGYVFVVW